MNEAGGRANARNGGQVRGQVSRGRNLSSLHTNERRVLSVVLVLTPHPRCWWQRVATLLIYLNNVADGGATDFPTIGWGYR